jgi:rhamnosyltransferase subunit B
MMVGCIRLEDDRTVGQNGESMHAVLTPVGSAGDINPFVMIGRALRRRGHRVTLIGPAVFGEVAVAAGLEFVAVGTAADFERATNNPDLWHPRRGPRVVFGEIAPQLRAGYAAIERVYEPGDTVLVGHSLSFFTRVFEERRGAPAVTVHLSPGVFRSDFRQSAMPNGADLSGWPRWMKRTLWWAVDRVGIDPLIAPPLNAWRAELGLPPVTRVFKSWFHSPQRVVALFPDWFGDPQPDWPAQTRLTGFVLSDESCGPSAAGPDRELDAFLAAGDPPIVFTPGSANRFAAGFFGAALAATSAIERRAVFVTRYREHLPRSLPSSVHHAPYASFGRLFPRAAVAVHHGGIGTCAQAFAAGVPQLMMPIGFDQPDNAARATRLGVAAAIAPKSFSGPRVAATLQRLLADDGVTRQCRRWREQVEAADALGRACDLIEAALAPRGPA